MKSKLPVSIHLPVTLDLLFPLMPLHSQHHSREGWLAAYRITSQPWPVSRELNKFHARVLLRQNYRITSVLDIKKGGRLQISKELVGTWVETPHGCTAWMFSIYCGRWWHGRWQETEPGLTRANSPWLATMAFLLNNTYNFGGSMNAAPPNRRNHTFQLIFPINFNRAINRTNHQQKLLYLRWDKI